ncbi:zf-HC2 domain-containing protein [Nocardia seriolae]|uniref:Anti-sigma-L factor RslA n=1 Tax=Nocardia seriolae TaxID=37332 RepID=A0ABC9YN73_9NOCA|nr:zf-HC2 domain-containing protein [Nocardia seriolae]APA95077.1 Anti-sigma-L factor RslA [Nocardia seriolae]MTJ66824.1 zf-HC2 domain-containing protein [Nocardia seriolae]MTJ70377.1 zf-HC2 domain-containing protein [Nocardia seriolae]MTK45902.1 zf-HC2 domain-containing protein [Nocardia seriolae]MTL10944.1 zf-HC2 domain-containing protein [Nocardia seriolae]
MTEGHELCDGYTTWDGAYVLGALARDDRREYEDHLIGCDACRTAVSKLAGLPGLLALVDTDTALSLAAQEDPPATVPPPPERLLPTLAAQAVKRRRRRRWWTLGGPVAAAAAVMIAVPVTATVAREQTPAVVQQVVAQGPLKPQSATPIQATFKVITVNGQTRVDMWCKYPPATDKDDEGYLWTLSLWVTREDGVQSKLAEWTVKPGQVLTPDGTTSVSPDQLKTVEIRNMSGNVLLAANI